MFVGVHRILNLINFIVFIICVARILCVSTKLNIVNKFKLETSIFLFQYIGNVQGHKV